MIKVYEVLAADAAIHGILVDWTMGLNDSRSHESLKA